MAEDAQGNHWTCKIDASGELGDPQVSWNGIEGTADIRFDEAIFIEAAITNDGSGEPAEDGDTSVGVTMGDVGEKFGFVQTLVRSVREVEFEGGGKLRLIPGGVPPCLDAQYKNPDNFPFYDDGSKCELPEPGDDKAIKFEDAPFTPIPIRCKDADGEERQAVSYTADEDFVLALVVQHQGQNTILRQWKWGYTLVVSGDMFKDPPSFTPRPREQTDGSEPMIWDEPAATDEEKQKKYWTNGYSVHDDHKDIKGYQGEPDPEG
ncbi:hypothetical protein OQA88_1112 [Cercophora sp. LCS_1]